MRLSFGLLGVFILLASGQLGYAQDLSPTYQRQRQAVWGGAQYAPTGVYHGPAGPAYLGGYYGYGNAYSGTWYQRPYPYHFDYYRGRFNASQIESIRPDCPCAQPASPE